MYDSSSFCDELDRRLMICSSCKAVRAQVSEAQKIASGSGSEQDIAEAKAELEVRIPLRIRRGHIPEQADSLRCLTHYKRR